ncbi:MAG: methylated-DNA--[protein]-cysteine S-methyltransferase [Actinomycetota bacterium]|nr:methylated-DNA--[protein]-cysteine S-methyltransferase [Actinomycetota bacterium]
MNAKELKRLAPAAKSEARARGATGSLAARAAGEGLVDVAVATMDSPVGELFVAVTSKGLVTVAYETESREEVWQRLVRQVSPRVLEAAAPTDDARRELEEYFRAGRRRFDLGIDDRLMSAFARSVLRATSSVGFGELATYGEIAARIDRPKAARAVGRALGSNPIPIVIPCHRIVGVSGSLTGYAGGLARKQTLLRLEGSLT